MAGKCDGPEIGAAGDEQEAAFELLFGHLGDVDREALIGLSAQSGPAAGLLAARRGGRMTGAVWAQLQPGATAILWPPVLTEGEEETTASTLIRAAVDTLAEKGVRMVQTMAESAAHPAAARLVAAGFTYLADLQYLVSALASFPRLCPRGPAEFEPYEEPQAKRLAAVIDRTYEGTRDCPRLDGVRRIEDVLAGYRATGTFDPQRWLFVRLQGRDIGCLLLADHPAAGHFELIYMGVAPEARGQGLGTEIARWAQWLTREAGRSRLVLAVDAENQPAIDVYRSVGFVRWDQRSVLVRVLDQPAAGR